MGQNFFEWCLLLLRWLHIVAAVTWIGESIFFMWLDRSFVKNPNATRKGHIGELWMVHGGGFYNVEKIMLGPAGVPKGLHWFKWEAAWTWISGMLLLCLIFYTGEGTFLLDNNISNLSFYEAIGVGLGTIFGSWFLYDLLWESPLAKKAGLAHLITMLMVIGATYLFCHTLSGRAAYIHMGALLGTWMVGNVWVRIIPRQQKMIDETIEGKPVNQSWGINAKNRSTHNTYFTLPIVFIMISNHFPGTYGHEENWIILLLLCLAGAALRYYFVLRVQNPALGNVFLFPMVGSFVAAFFMTTDPAYLPGGEHSIHPNLPKKEKQLSKKAFIAKPYPETTYKFSGRVLFEGEAPKAKKLRLPKACANQFDGDVYDTSVLIKDNGLKNVLLRIENGRNLGSFPDTPPKAAVLDQIGCIYKPRLIAARVGQVVTFINSDPIFHNVKSVTKKNTNFNLSMPELNQKETKVFNHPEISLQTKCSIHPWMSAHIAIMDHPFYSITNELGHFSIDLPEGKHNLLIWHEVFGEKKIEIEIKDKNITQNITIK